MITLPADVGGRFMPVFARRLASRVASLVERARMLCEMHVHGEATLERRRLRTAEEALCPRRRGERANARGRLGGAPARLQRIAYGLCVDQVREFHDKVLLRVLLMSLTKQPICSKTKNFCLKIRSNFIELAKQSPSRAANLRCSDTFAGGILLKRRQEDYGGIPSRPDVLHVTPQAVAKRAPVSGARAWRRRRRLRRQPGGRRVGLGGMAAALAAGYSDSGGRGTRIVVRERDSLW